MNLDDIYLKEREPQGFVSEVSETIGDLGSVAKTGLDMAASGLKGVTQGGVGLLGDLSLLSQMIANKMGANFDEETFFYTTEEVKKMLDENKVPGISNFVDTSFKPINTPDSDFKPETVEFLKRLYDTSEFTGEMISPAIELDLIAKGIKTAVKTAPKIKQKAGEFVEGLDESVLRPTGSIEPGAFLPNKKKSKKVIDTIPKPKGKILKNVDSSMLNLVQGQWIKWKEPVFEGSFRKPKYVGDRTFSGTIQNESYGAEKGQHTFTIVLDSREGVNSDQYLDGEKIRRKGRNLYPNVQETILAKDTKTKELIKNIEGLGVKISKASDKMDSKAVDRLSSERIELQKQLDKLKEKEQTTKDDTKGSK